MSDVTTSVHVPLSDIHFIVPRKCQIVVLPDGTHHKVWLETEEEWGRKCGLMRNVNK